MPRGSLYAGMTRVAGSGWFIRPDTYTIYSHTRNRFLHTQSIATHTIHNGTAVGPGSGSAAPRVSSSGSWVQHATALRRERVISSTGHRCANHSHLALLSRASSAAPPCGWCTTPPHIPPPPDLGRGAIRPNPLPPPPHGNGKGSRPQPSGPPAYGSPGS